MTRGSPVPPASVPIPSPSPPIRFTSVLLLLLLPLAVPAAVGAGHAEAPDPTLRTVHDPGLEPLRAGAGAAGSVAAPFRVRIDGAPVPLRITALPALPAGQVRIRVPGSARATLTHQAGVVSASGGGSWRWTAPDAPGAYALRLDQDGASVHVTVLVQHPAERVRDGVLEGYAIGRYVQTPLRGDPAYLPPAGFVEVSDDDAGLLVSPRLTLGQFLCKQPGDPRFVALSPPLLEKLEAILDGVAAEGWDPASLVVMSGFRTPAYNRAIGNTTVYSRHLWGDAADIYLDGDGDGVMDDLDGDGRSGEGDARALARLVERVMAEREGLSPGGLATYRANAAHGPFVHVDARGHRARW